MAGHFIVLGLSLSQDWQEEDSRDRKVCYLCGGPLTQPRFGGPGERVFCSLPCLEEYAS